MKKTIWLPLVLGITLGLLDFVSWAGDFLIPLGPYGATGPQEVFITLSAALGGPLGLATTCLLHELGNYSFGLKSLFSPEQMSSTGTLYSIADFAAHIVAAMTAAYGYKLLHHRAKKIYVYIGGWMLIIVVYYTLLVSLQFILIGFIIDLPPLSVLFRNFLPEFLVVVIITSLILLALPRRYRRLLWLEKQFVPPSAEDKG